MPYADYLYDLKCEHMKNPLGTDAKAPRFSWKLKSDKAAMLQTAYRITVSDEAGKIVWDSGVTKSDNSCAVRYEGEPLCEEMRYFWTVTAYYGDESYTESAWFETGTTDWKEAKWIGRHAKNTAAMRDYTVKMGVRLVSGEKLGVALSCRNRDNYILYEIEPKECSLKVFEYTDNAWSENPAASVTELFEGEIPAVADRRFELEITVKSGKVFVLIDGKTVIDGEEILPREESFKPRKTTLLSIGFKQYDSLAEFDSIEVYDGNSGELVASEDFATYGGAYACAGEVKDGKLTVENRFEVVCPVPAALMKRDINITKKIKKARLYATARGFYKVWINNQEADATWFNPGFTDYRLRLMYQTYDVTDKLKNGENVIGVMLAKGYYNGFCGYSGANIYGTENSFFARLAIEYEDGSRDNIVTDEMWQLCSFSPVTDSDYLDGESVDARLFDELENLLAWGKCDVFMPPEKPVPSNGSFEKEVDFILSADRGGRAEVERILTPIAVKEVPKGRFVYDFGQNMVGSVRIKLKGSRGRSIKLRYAEMSKKNGEAYVRNLRSAANTDTYTLSGNGVECFSPTFTAHGFRYMEISGNGEDISGIEIISVEGLVITNVSESSGSFSCSNELVNQLCSNIEWGQRGNYLLVPTDCPQRNERQGWTGDAQVFAATAAYNADVLAFTEKWLCDLSDAQLMYNKDGAVPDTAPLGGDNRADGCAGWGDAAVIVPWEMYLAYGDKTVLEENYEMMRSWVEYQNLESRRSFGRCELAEIPYIQTQQRRGDHLTFDESTPFVLSATAYAAGVAKIMSETAAVLGKADDEKLYNDRYEKIRTAFMQAWVKEDYSLGYTGEESKNSPTLSGKAINKTYYCENGEETPSQTAYALAIDYVLDEKQGKRMGEFLKKAVQKRGNKLSVGFLGISHLMNTLSKTGNDETAFRLLEQTENPSWLYSVINGATTIWERWDSYIAETDTFGEVSMNSFNHYAYGAVGEWLYKRVAGINTSREAAGFKRIILEPTVGGSLTWAKACFESPYGEILSHWDVSDKFRYTCKIPPNTTAELRLFFKPTSISGEAVYKGEIDGKYVYELLSGEYVMQK